MFRLLCAALCSISHWLHFHVVAPVVQWWEGWFTTLEESFATIVRQLFEEATRALNGIAAWWLSLLNYNYKQHLKQSWEQNPWQKWWSTVEHRPSTLNALVAVLHPPVQGEDGAETSDAAPSHSPAIHAVASALSSRNGVRQNVNSQRPAQPGQQHTSAPNNSWLPAWPGRKRYEVTVAQQAHAIGSKTSRKPTMPVLDETRSAVFMQPSGMGIIDAMKRLGLLEELKLKLELQIISSFDFIRNAVRTVFGLPKLPPRPAQPPTAQVGKPQKPAPTAFTASGTTAPAARNPAFMHRSKSAHVRLADLDNPVPSPSNRPHRTRLRRSRSFSKFEAVCQHLPELSSAGEVIKLAGYPVEEYEVETDDGYVIQMHRIPNRMSHDVVFFMHGVLDSPLAWVSAGVTGSQAFAAWDAGFDVWLGNVRSNWPRKFRDPKLAGMAYWQYDNAHLGTYDVTAQLRFIDETKCVELGQGEVNLNLDNLGPHAEAMLSGAGMRTSNSDGDLHRNLSRFFSIRSESGLDEMAHAGQALADLPESSTEMSSEPSYESAEEATNEAVAAAQLSSSGPQLLSSSAGMEPLLTQSGSSPSHGHGLKLEHLAQPDSDPSQSTAMPTPVTSSSPSLLPSAPAAVQVQPSAFNFLAAGLQSFPHVLHSTPNRALSAPSPARTAPGPSRAQSGALSSQLLHSPRHLPPSPQMSYASSSFPLAFENQVTLPVSNRVSQDGVVTLADAEPVLGSFTLTAKTRVFSDESPHRSMRNSLDCVHVSHPSSPMPGSAQLAYDSSPFAHASATPFRSGRPSISPPARSPNSQGSMRAELAPSIDTSLAHFASAHSEVSVPSPGPAVDQAPSIQRCGAELSMAPVSPQGTDIGRQISTVLESASNGMHSTSSSIGKPSPFQVLGSNIMSAIKGSMKRADTSSDGTIASSSSAQHSAPHLPDRLTTPTIPLIPRKLEAWQRTGSLNLASKSSPQQNGMSNIPRSGSHEHLSFMARTWSQGPYGEPYRLRVVAHSLGGMSMLIYLHHMLERKLPHHVDRLILLTPAGFHNSLPWIGRPMMFIFPHIIKLIRWLWKRNFAAPLLIPTTFARALTFRLFLDASRIAGVGELLRVAFHAMLNGDASQWDRALQMPHYSAAHMPALSVDQLLHMMQIAQTGRFQLYDLGSWRANWERYGSSIPPNVAEAYNLIDIPVDLVAGKRDGIIPRENVQLHYEKMKEQGVQVTYKEFDFGHLDFTFAVKEDLKMYLMRLLRKGPCKTGNS